MRKPHALEARDGSRGRLPGHIGQFAERFRDGFLQRSSCPRRPAGGKPIRIQLCPRLGYLPLEVGAVGASQEGLGSHEHRIQDDARGPEQPVARALYKLLWASHPRAGPRQAGALGFEIVESEYETHDPPEPAVGRAS